MQIYVNAKFDAISKQVEVWPKKRATDNERVMKCGHLLVIKRINTLVWLALDTQTKEIVGIYIDARSRIGALIFMAVFTPTISLLVQYAIPISAKAYEEIFPASRHQAVSKKSGKTNLTNAL